MRAVAKIDQQQIENMELDITFRMKVSEWREVMRNQPTNWAGSELGMKISEVLGHVSKSTAITLTAPMHAADDNR